MIIGFSVVAVLLVAVVVNATTAYLHRQSLNSLADGAALAAVDGLQGASVYRGGLDEAAAIDPDAAAVHVADHLAAVGAEHPGLRYDVAVDGARVVVRVAAPVQLPFRVPGAPSRAVVTGTAAAVAEISR